MVMLRKNFSPLFCGFTLIELMVVVAIIGLLASVAVPLVGKYLRKSKVSEAYTSVRKIYDGEMAYYYEEHVNSAGSALSKDFLVLFPMPPFPPTPDKRYGDFSSGNWPLVKFAPDGLALYSYMADTVNNPNPIPQPLGVPQLPQPDANWQNAFVARAMGDIDGDGIFSMFERLAIVKKGEIEGAPAIFAWDELE